MNIIDIIPAEYITYVEVIGDVNRLIYNKSVSKIEIFNDRYSGIYNLFKILRDRREEFLDLVYNKKDIKNWREEDNNLEKAVKFYLKIEGIEDKNIDVDGSKYLRDKLINDRMVNIINRLRILQIENIEVGRCIRKYDKKSTFMFINLYKERINQDSNKNLIRLLNSLDSKILISDKQKSIYNNFKEDKWSKEEIEGKNYWYNY